MKLRIINIKKAFGGIVALDNCSFVVPQGKIVALIGPNGSGKSTLFHVISGIINADAGKIFFDETDISHADDVSIARSGISRTFQEVRLFRHLTIREHMEIVLAKENEKMLQSVVCQGQQLDDEHVQKHLYAVGLRKPLSTVVTALSYGQRKLLDLCLALAKPHSLLMLDEPVAGVNPQLREQIKKILLALKKKGETLLIIEHDMNFLMDIADHVVVMDYGKVIAEGKPKDIQNNKSVLEAYLGA